MKKIVVVSVLLGVLAILLSVIAAVVNPAVPDTITDDAAEADPSPDLLMRDIRTPMLGWNDSRATVRLLYQGETREVSMYDYLVGTVAAEMPAAFEVDALCAQAVAARTYVFYHMLISPPANHPDADVCGDFGCCAAYADEAALREQWGESYETYIDRIQAAVRLTDGVYITYEDMPILAAFHSSSYLATEDAEKVWANALPYLVSVATPETPEEVTNLISSVTVSKADFSATVLASYPEAKLSGDTRAWISDMTFDDSGRVDTICIGGVTLTGPQLRALFSLRSAAVSITIGDDIVFETKGYGHGVGLSQYGANIMAKGGATWREIIKTYYTGIELSDEKGVPPTDSADSSPFDTSGENAEAM